MSVDFQFISVVDDLQVLELEEIENSQPRTLRIYGIGGFNAAQRVEINDFGISNFTIVNDTTLLVSPPAEIFSDVPVSRMRAVVVSGQLSSPRKARLVFGPTKRTRKVEGIQKLVQQVVKELLSDVGSNRFRPSDGGGILAALGMTLDSSSQSQIASILSQGASRVQDAFLSRQAQAKRLTPGERLLKFEVSQVQFNPAELEVIATLQLVTYAGRSFEIPLVL